MIEVVVKQVVRVDPKTLRRVRERAGLSQRAIARELELRDHNLMSELEGGKKTRLDYELLRSIAHVMAGNGDYVEVSGDQVLAEILGRVVIETEKRTVVRPIKAGSGTAPLPSGAILEPLDEFVSGDKEEAPAGTGASRTTERSTAGGSTQMS